MKKQPKRTQPVGSFRENQRKRGCGGKKKKRGKKERGKLGKGSRPATGTPQKNREFQGKESLIQGMEAPKKPPQKKTSVAS